MREVLPAPVILHDHDLLVGEAIELVDDLVDQPVCLFDSRQQWSQRRHRVLVFPAQVVLELALGRIGAQLLPVLLLHSPHSGQRCQAPGWRRERAPRSKVDRGDGARGYGRGASPYSLFHDPDLLVGEAV